MQEMELQWPCRRRARSMAVHSSKCPNLMCFHQAPPRVAPSAPNAQARMWKRSCTCSQETRPITLCTLHCHPSLLYIPILLMEQGRTGAHLEEGLLLCALVIDNACVCCYITNALAVAIRQIDEAIFHGAGRAKHPIEGLHKQMGKWARQAFSSCWLHAGCNGKVKS